MPGSTVDPLKRNKVSVLGNPDAPHTLVFVHGFGSDQGVWREVIAPFLPDHRVVLLDHVGTCEESAEVFMQDRYLNLTRYARDLVEVCERLQLRQVVFVGHSVGAMIAALATVSCPGLASGLVMIGGSPRYRDDEGYKGGCTAADISHIYDAALADYERWSSSYSRHVMGNAHRPQLADRFAASLRNIPRQRLLTVLCSILQTDYRREMAKITVPTLLLQASNDPVVPMEVAEYLRDTIANSRLVLLDAEGHLPHVSAPLQVVSAISEFLSGAVARAVP